MNNIFKTGKLSAWTDGGAIFPLSSGFDRDKQEVVFADAKEQPITHKNFNLPNLARAIYEARETERLVLNDAGTWISKSDAIAIQQRAVMLGGIDRLFKGYALSLEELGWCAEFERHTGFRVQKADEVLSPVEFLRVAKHNLEWFEKYATEAYNRADAALRGLSYYNQNILQAVKI